MLRLSFVVRTRVRLVDNKIHIFGARRANVTGLGAREPRAEELALPKSVESGNLGLNKAVIRWISVNLKTNRTASHDIDAT
jgi:hypothetical protein